MSSKAELTDIAARLYNASAFEPIDVVRDELDGMADAYEVQAQNYRRWINSGRVQTGYKVAYTTLESQQLFGTTEPVYGALFKDMEFPSGSTVPAGRLAKPKLEGEIVMELSADLPSGSLDPESVRAAIGAIYAGLEIPDGCIRGKKNAVDMAADNASASGYVLGERCPIDGDFDLATIGLKMAQNGEIVDSGVSEVCMGSPLNVLVWLANALAKAGQPLRKGQIVFAGSLIPIIPVQPGDSFEATVDHLGKVSCHFQPD
jgi:2-keto-4-pentenoate hydratase